MARIKLTRRQIATIISIIVSPVLSQSGVRNSSNHASESESESEWRADNVQYLGALTALAGYATHSSRSFSLPLPNTLSALALALPPIAGLAIETSTALASSLSSHPNTRNYRATKTSSIPPVLLPSTLTILLLVVYCTVVATLAGTHISPLGGLGCALGERWSELFRGKKGERIRRIQDQWQCCGFRSTRDMAYPFPTNNVRSDACATTFDRTRACFEPWREQERLVAGLMLGVAVGVFLWIIVIVATPVVQPSWAKETLGRQLLYEEDGAEQGRRTIQYRDNPEDEAAEDDSVRHEIEGLNRESQLGSVVEGSRTRPSALLNDDNRWRVSDDTR